jgi:hypothetical protein
MAPESHSCGHDSLNACVGHRYLPNCNHKFTPMSKVVLGELTITRRYRKALIFQILQKGKVG